MTDTLLPEHVDHVSEIFVVPALIRRHRDAIRVLLNRRPHDIRHAAVVPQVHDFRAMRLQQPANHVDGRIVTIEQRRRTDEPQWVRLASRRATVGMKRQDGSSVHFVRLGRLGTDQEVWRSGPNLPASIFSLAPLGQSASKPRPQAR